MKSKYVVPTEATPSEKTFSLVEEFLKTFQLKELESGIGLLLHFDKKSNSFYFTCHLDDSTLVDKCDLEASLSRDEEDEIYKLNRDITEDKSAYKLMEDDAKEGRTFEDIVLEYDTTYRTNKPLKVYGGQHRIRAIKNTIDNLRNRPSNR